MPIDQRGRDDPPIFSLSPQIGGFKYHALLTETVWFPTKLLTDWSRDADAIRTGKGEVSNRLDIGLYGFQTIEAREKFCRRANAIAETDSGEKPCAFAVTVPNLYMDQPMVTAIRYQPTPATGPVADQSER